MRPRLPNWQLCGESPPMQAPVLGSTTETNAFGFSHWTVPAYSELNSYQYQDNLSKQLGRHALKTGFQYINDNTAIGFLPNANGVYTFSNFQQYLNDTPSSFAGAAGIAVEKPHELDQAYYIQDDFRFRPNLTFNLGLRYEYSGQPLNLLNQETVARESNPSTAIWNTALPLADRTYPSYPAPSENFAPRMGVAWTPQQRDGFLGKVLGHLDHWRLRGRAGRAADNSRRDQP